MTEKEIEEKAIAYARKVFLENNGVGGNGIDYNQYDVDAYLEGYKEAKDDFWSRQSQIAKEQSIKINQHESTKS